LVKYTDAPDPVPNDTKKVDPAAATQEKVEGKRFKSRKILRVLDKKGSYTHGPIIFIGQEAPTKTPQVLVSNDRIVSSDGCTKPTYCYVLWDIDSYTIAFPNSNYCSSIS
jgi:hypothetical protein